MTLAVLWKSKWTGVVLLAGFTWLFAEWFLYGPSPGKAVAALAVAAAVMTLRPEMGGLEMASMKSGTAASDITSFRRGFSRIDFLTIASLYRPLGFYSIPGGEGDKHYLVEIYARNGGFQELLRVRRIKEGGWTEALIVSASYFSGVKGVVLERIDRQFPKAQLDSDHDWQALKKLRTLKIKE